MLGVAVAAGVIVVCAIIVGAIALHASASDDLSVSRQMTLAHIFKDYDQRYQRAKRAQKTILLIALACLGTDVWAAYVFAAALESDKEPTSLSAALPAGAICTVGILICFYQFAHFGVRRRAITKIRNGK